MRRVPTLALLLGGLGACAAEPALEPDAGRRPSPDATVVDASTSVDAGVLDAGAGDVGLRDAGPNGPNPLDEGLGELLALLPDPVTALEPLEPEPAGMVELGELLFFDPILSGNKDIACASCHQAESATGDGLPLALGTGAEGRGAERQAGAASWGRRHTPNLWNLGRLSTLFWDGRVSETSTSSGPPLPAPLADPLARQALHPILTPDEMLGAPGDVAVDGQPNELAGAPAREVYARLEARLSAVPAYRVRFDEVFGPGGVSLANAVLALGAFQRARFDVTDTPWDRYLRGDLAAMSDAAKLGAIVFFGAGQCANCHRGALLTDQRFHNIGIPLLEPLDRGRAAVDVEGAPFGFRTPPLRNAAASPPFMHNGTFQSLQDILRHYSNPERTAPTYVGDALPADLAARVVTEVAPLEDLLMSLSPDLPVASSGSTPVGLSNIRQFLLHLVDDDSIARARARPERVPSGLLVGGR